MLRVGRARGQDQLPHRHRLGDHLGHLARPLLRLFAELLPEPLQEDDDLPGEQLHSGTELQPVGQAGVVGGDEVQIHPPHAARQPKVQADERSGSWERRSESRERNWESESELWERETILA